MLCNSNFSAATPLFHSALREVDCMIMVSNGRSKSNMKKQQQNGPEVPELLTLTEACEMLKVHPNTLRQWDKNGVLPAIRIGTKRVRRYRKEDIVSFLQAKP